MKVWREKIDFNDLLKTDEDIMKYLSESEVDSLFDISKIMKNINKVYKRLELK